MAQLPATKPKMGRPPVHGPEVEDEICRQLACGTPLDTICKQPGMPNIVTVLHWASGDRPDFGQKYTRAREAMATRLVAEAIELVDKPSKDSVEAADKRVRADMRKWLASKLFPRQYGDKVEQSVQALDKDGKPTDLPRPLYTVVIEG